MTGYILRQNPTPQDSDWVFTTPGPLNYPRNPRPGTVYGKFIKFTKEAITLAIEKLPNNRVIQSDDPKCFILLSFADLRFPDTPIRETGDYIARLLTKGLFLDGIQYRFYHHSNSQLRGRSCFLRQANSDGDLDRRIYPLGDFERIMNAAKRAKRIGLLYSEAQVDYQLDINFIQDIPDIKSGDELFSDGCGLISKWLAIQLSRKKKIIFRGKRYTPAVFQIRYLGYKGVVMLHPAMDKNNEKNKANPDSKPIVIQFRDSMRKFKTTTNTTFSVVDHSRPYSFGRLNNDVLVLLCSLGVTKEKILGKQAAYHQWIESAITDPIKAFNFLSTVEDYPSAERVLLEGIEDKKVQDAIRAAQRKEINSFKNDRQKARSRIIVEKSRLLFGVCDPFRVLKEGQVHIRITTPSGASTLIHGDVIVVRNPCLHAGDILKLRAVDHPQLAHLVDCLVFASVAKPGHHAAPSMSSGGDLDGDKFFVCWDPDLVPSTIAESYDYPPNREPPTKPVTRKDMSDHFAYYNASGVARVAALHQQWARSSPKGALCQECQELNALHSQSVDGANIKIPERLQKTPEIPDGAEPYILDLLAENDADFADRFGSQGFVAETLRSQAPSSATDAEELLRALLSTKSAAVSEFELFQLTVEFSRKYALSIEAFMCYFDLSIFTVEQKYAILTILGESTAIDTARFWNSLLRSDLLRKEDLFERSLHQPFRLQRLYSSKQTGLTTFFSYLRRTITDFTRKVILLKIDDRFVVGIFIRGDIPWDEDPEVNQNVVVCSFLPHTSSSFSTYRPCVNGYKLHCSETVFQLYDRHIGNSFVYLQRRSGQGRSGMEVAASIALQKISDRVKKQIGRVYKEAVTAVEMHVVSNRDRVSHQLFDLWFEHISTEKSVRRFERERVDYRLNAIPNADSELWQPEETWLKELFLPKKDEAAFTRLIQTRILESERDAVMNTCIKYHLHEELYWTFVSVISSSPIPEDFTVKWIRNHPPLSFALLRQYPPTESNDLPTSIASMGLWILKALVQSANEFGMASLVALEKLKGVIVNLRMDDYIELLWLTACSVRPRTVFQEILLVFNDIRSAHDFGDTSFAYGHKYALGIAFDRAEEAADECPCDDQGIPRRQRTPPAQTRLSFTTGESEPSKVKAILRVDARSPIRLHAHVRLQVASREESIGKKVVIDGLVVGGSKGEVEIELMYPAPPETERVDWNMYYTGSIATSRAMLDALSRLVRDKEECCSFYEIIVSKAAAQPPAPATTQDDVDDPSSSLNPSQQAAARSCGTPLSLIWGPPGTGKTTVVVEILCRLLQETGGQSKILMTASTHNAVDNVLERFVERSERHHLQPEQILRVATDVSKVNKNLHRYTIDARVGGDMNENNKLFKQAQEKLKAALIIFTTCAGAGLGILRKVDFDIALIDEASQITEPTALVPLVKGIQRAVLVGDHVQLRPTVKKMGSVIQFDVSLLERLYTGPTRNDMSKTMLDIQYRFPQELAHFPSQEFYEGKLRSGIQDSLSVLGPLLDTSFPWPQTTGQGVIPTVFVPCTVEEDMGGQSKSNPGQVELVVRIVKMLTTARPSAPAEDATPRRLSITVLSPYRKQISLLNHALPGSVTCSTVDAFQGREADVIIFSSVRCNAEGEIGFLDDARRLNVMWTRARLGLIIVGDRRTISTNGLWKRALDSCSEVVLPEEYTENGDQS